MKFRPRKLSVFQVGLLLLGAAAVGALYTPYPAALVRALRRAPAPQVKIIETVREVPVPAPPVQPPAAPTGAAAPHAWQPAPLLPMPEIQLPPFPPALPERVETGTFQHLNTLSQGQALSSTLTFHKGTTAARDRKVRNAYLLNFNIDILLPHAAEGRELLHANPHLDRLLLKFDDLMANARVSPWFHALYLHKQNHVRKSLSTLSKPLDRHNFYDTDTILEITAPGTERRALWIQADMDVVSDGSDGDRLPTMPEAIRKSDHYQPTTSYRWKKRTKTPNPLLARWEARLATLQKAKPKDNADIDYTRRVIFDLKRYSYLLAQYDPFIVIPLTVKEGRSDTFRPAPGDYAVVIVGKRIVPAIVGDYGPKHKTGEASLRLGKIFNPKADVYARPVSTLEASYIIFPHTAEPEAGPIDYTRLNTRCRELLDELGGIGPEAEYTEVSDMLAPAAQPVAEP